MVTKCYQLKLTAADGKKYLTDVANRLRHSVLPLVPGIIKQVGDPNQNYDWPVLA